MNAHSSEHLYSQWVVFFADSETATPAPEEILVVPGPRPRKSDLRFIRGTRWRIPLCMRRIGPYDGPPTRSEAIDEIVRRQALRLEASLRAVYDCQPEEARI